MELNKKWIEVDKKLERFILKRVKDKSLARELLHQVYLKVAENASMLKDEKKVIPWMYQITRNVIIDHFRKINKLVPLSTIEPLKTNEASDIGLTAEFSACISPLMYDLPSFHRELLLKADIEGVSQKQLSEQLAIPYPTLKSKVQRARKKLKEKILSCCEVESDRYGNITSVEERGCDCDLQTESFMRMRVYLLNIKKF
jgi:RNA polymerase sigma-70 factor (ECF subfamily)